MLDLSLDSAEIQASWVDFAGAPARLVVCSVVGPPDEELLSRVSAAERDRARGLQSPVRAAEWAASRRAKLQAVAELVAQGADSRRIQLSLSHTRGQAVAIAREARENDTVGGIGVDLEDSARVVSPLVLARITDLSDRIWTKNLTGIELWTIKEASFKANPASTGTYLPQYRVVGAAPDGTEGEIHESTTHARVRYRLLRVGGWSLALALGFR